MTPPDRAGSPTPGPPTPWVARGSRIYASDGEEIAVATRTSPRWRARADETARTLALAPDLADAVRVLAAVLDSIVRMEGLKNVRERSMTAMEHPAVVAALAALKGVG